jgi:L-fuconolactonase
MENNKMNQESNKTSLSSEEILDPQLPICDSHHHLRRPEKGCYLINDLIEDAANGHNIVSTVYIQSIVNQQKVPGGGMTPVEETEFVIGEIAKNKTKINIAAGIIGYVNFFLGKAVDPILEAHVAAGKKRFRGIRFTPKLTVDVKLDTKPGVKPDLMPANVPDDWLLDPIFQEGFACLKKYDLVFDALLYNKELLAAEKLARKFPDTPIIVNHLGIRDYEGDGYTEWKRVISALMSFENVYLKLGGLGMHSFKWNKPPNSQEVAKELEPYLMFCIEKFGVKKCMFESNFPVDKVSYSYDVIWNAFKRITQKLSKTERNSLFHDTAAKVYRLAK